MRTKMPAERMRLFVAVDIPDEVRERIAAAVERSRGACPEARWVKAENLHLTLKFIGSFDVDDIDRLHDELRRVAESTQPFAVALGGCGGFPTSGKARVIWVGMTKGEEEASVIAGRLDSVLEKLGVKTEERPFRGHLALARLRTPRDCRALISYLEEELRGLEGMSFRVGEMILYRSVLSPSGPVYHPLQRLSLEGRSVHEKD